MFKSGHSSETKARRKFVFWTKYIYRKFSLYKSREVRVNYYLFFNLKIILNL